MKLTSTCFALACGLCTLLSPQALAQHSGEHIMLAPSELTWTDLPSLPGVKIAIIEGQLNQAVPIMFRLKFPPISRSRPIGIPASNTSPSFRAHSTWALEVSSIARRPARSRQAASPSCSREPTIMCGPMRKRSAKSTASGRGRSITSIQPTIRPRNNPLPARDEARK
jgi:hypothetical protein